MDNYNNQSNPNTPTPPQAPGPQMPPPQMPPQAGSALTRWSVMLGGMGIIANCCCMIWNLPAGIFLGIAGVVTAVLSKKGARFTPQATLGLILSIISIGIGFIMVLLTVYALNLMKTDPEAASLARQIYQAIQDQLYGGTQTPAP